MSDTNVHDSDAKRQRALRLINDLVKDKPEEFQVWLRVVATEVADVISSPDPIDELRKKMVVWNRLMVEEDRLEFEQFVKQCIIQYERISRERDAEGETEGKVIKGDFGGEKKR